MPSYHWPRGSAGQRNSWPTARARSWWSPQCDFGNAAELIIALAALRAGLHDVVKATIVGSIVGNILLVLGAAMLAGGMRHQEQHFDESAGRAQATMLTLAAIALVIPAAYSALVGELYPGEEWLSAFRFRWCSSPSMSRSFCSLCGLTLVFSGRRRG